MKNDEGGMRGHSRVERMEERRTVGKREWKRRGRGDG